MQYLLHPIDTLFGKKQDMSKSSEKTSSSSSSSEDYAAESKKEMNDIVEKMINNKSIKIGICKDLDFDGGNYIILKNDNNYCPVVFFDCQYNTIWVPVTTGKNYGTLSGGAHLTFLKEILDCDNDERVLTFFNENTIPYITKYNAVATCPLESIEGVQLYVDTTSPDKNVFEKAEGVTKALKTKFKKYDNVDEWEKNVKAGTLIDIDGVSIYPLQYDASTKSSKFEFIYFISKVKQMVNNKSLMTWMPLAGTGVFGKDLSEALGIYLSTTFPLSVVTSLINTSFDGFKIAHPTYDMTEVILGSSTKDVFKETLENTELKDYVLKKEMFVCEESSLGLNDEEFLKYIQKMHEKIDSVVKINFTTEQVQSKKITETKKHKNYEQKCIKKVASLKFEPGKIQEKVKSVEFFQSLLIKYKMGLLESVGDKFTGTGEEKSAYKVRMKAIFRTIIENRTITNDNILFLQENVDKLPTFEHEGMFISPTVNTSDKLVPYNHVLAMISCYIGLTICEMPMMFPKDASAGIKDPKLLSYIHDSEVHIIVRGTGKTEYQLDKEYYHVHSMEVPNEQGTYKIDQKYLAKLWMKLTSFVDLHFFDFICFNTPKMLWLKQCLLKILNVTAFIVNRIVFVFKDVKFDEDTKPLKNKFYMSLLKPGAPEGIYWFEYTAEKEYYWFDYNAKTCELKMHKEEDKTISTFKIPQKSTFIFISMFKLTFAKSVSQSLSDVRESLKQLSFSLAYLLLSIILSIYVIYLLFNLVKKGPAAIKTIIEKRNEERDKRRFINKLIQMCRDEGVPASDIQVLTNESNIKMGTWRRLQTETATIFANIDYIHTINTILKVGTICCVCAVLAKPSNALLMDQFHTYNISYMNKDHQIELIDIDWYYNNTVSSMTCDFCEFELEQQYSCRGTKDCRGECAVNSAYHISKCTLADAEFPPCLLGTQCVQYNYIKKDYEVKFTLKDHPVVNASFLIDNKKYDITFDAYSEFNAEKIPVSVMLRSPTQIPWQMVERDDVFYESSMADIRKLCDCPYTCNGVDCEPIRPVYFNSPTFINLEVNYKYVNSTKNQKNSKCNINNCAFLKTNYSSVLSCEFNNDDCLVSFVQDDIIMEKRIMQSTQNYTFGSLDLLNIQICSENCLKLVPKTITENYKYYVTVSSENNNKQFITLLLASSLTLIGFTIFIMLCIYQSHIKTFFLVIYLPLIIIHVILIIIVNLEITKLAQILSYTVVFLTVLTVVFHFILICCCFRSGEAKIKTF